MPKEPTENDFATTVDTLEWLVEYLKENNPEAFRSISTLENAIVEIPTSVEELKG